VDKTVAYSVTEAGKTLTKSFAVGNYRTAFVVAGAACLAAALVSLAIKAPKKVQSA